MDKMRKTINPNKSSEERHILLHQQDNPMAQIDRKPGEVVTKINGGQNSPLKQTELTSSKLSSPSPAGSNPNGSPSFNRVWWDENYGFSKDAIKVAREFGFADSPVSRHDLSRIVESPTLSYTPRGGGGARERNPNNVPKMVQHRSNFIGGAIAGGANEVLVCTSNSLGRMSTLLMTKTKPRLMGPPEQDNRSQRMVLTTTTEGI